MTLVALSTPVATAVDWAGGPGPIAVYTPPHPFSLRADECERIIADPHHEWLNESPGVARVGRRIGDPQMRARILDPLVAANTLRWRHDIGTGDETVATLLRYTKGGGMDRHVDRQPRFNHDLIATSLVAQLTDGDDYEGGTVEFYVGDEVIRLPRAIGTVAVFDSTVPHQVLEVTAGVRYSTTVFGRPSPLPAVGAELIGWEPPTTPAKCSLLVVTPVVAPPTDGLLASWDYPNHLIVINGDSDAWRQRCQERGWAYRMDRYSGNLGCAASWNLAFARAKETGASHVAILSQGTVLAGGTRELARLVARHPQAPWIEISGGVRQSFHCIVFAVDVWDRVGGFDESLPVWCDVDFWRRLWLSGRWDRWAPRVVRVPLAARDVANTAVRAGVVPAWTYDVDRQRYAQKWGGGHCAETFARPWDPSSASPDVATPPRVLALDG